MKACIDIGGTKIAVTMVMGDQLLEDTKLVEPTIKKGGRDALAKQIIKMLEEVCLSYSLLPSALIELGISSCGPFETHEGMIELAAPNICGGMAGAPRGLPNKWTSALLEQPLREKFPGAVIKIVNDAVAALDAERRWGALVGFNHCAYVTWSTGIGIGLCVDGHLLRGKSGNAGHAGHMFVNDDITKALCGCGNLGDVEGQVGGHAMGHRFAQAGYADAAALLSAAKAGEANAVAIMDAQCAVMGRMLYNLAVTLDLQCIAIGGSVFMQNREWLLPRLKAQIPVNPTALLRGFNLVEAGLGDKVGDYAAFALLNR